RMSLFPQREGTRTNEDLGRQHPVQSLEDALEDDTEEGKPEFRSALRPSSKPLDMPLPDKDILRERLQTIPMLGLDREGLFDESLRSALSFEDDEGTSQPFDPLGDVMDWLGHADLGEDDPELALRRESSSGLRGGNSPGTPLGDAPSWPEKPWRPSFAAGGGPGRSSAYCGLGGVDQ
ncbi:unnamed protein product, partial [Polarella glacialis]